MGLASVVPSLASWLAILFFVMLVMCSHFLKCNFVCGPHDLINYGQYG